MFEDKQHLQPIDRLSKALGNKVPTVKRKSNFPAGKNPKSQANLNRKDCSQSFATRLAARFNWMKFLITGFKGGLLMNIRDIDELIHSSQFQYLSKDRQNRCKHTLHEAEVLLKNIDNLVESISSIKNSAVYTRSKGSGSRPAARPEH